MVSMMLMAKDVMGYLLMNKLENAEQSLILALNFQKIRWWRKYRKVPCLGH